MSNLTQEQIAARIAEAKAAQASVKGNGANSQGMAVYAYLQEHKSIRSDNPLLSKLNPKYPTDAVWTNCAVRMRDQLAAAGFVIVAHGRKPTVYTLVELPSVRAAAAAVATTGQATTGQAKPATK